MVNSSVEIYAQEKTKFSISKDEKWWGIYVYNAPTEPFMKPFQVSTNKYKADGSFTTSLLLSSKGRYIWEKDEIDVTFEDGSIEISSQEAVKENKAGRNLREAYLVWRHKNFPPSEVSFSKELITKPVYETRFELGYTQNQDQVLDYANKIIDQGLPPGIIVLCEGWRSLDGVIDFNKQIYPDPVYMVDQLHQKGFKIMLNLTPLIAPVGPGYMNYASQDLLLKDKEGKVLIVESNAGFNACVNISNNDVLSELQSGVNHLKQSYNVDGFRYDASVVLPHLRMGYERDHYLEQWFSLGNENDLQEFMPGSFERLSSHINCFEKKGDINWATLNSRVNNIITAGLCGYSYSHPLANKAQINGMLNDQRLMSYYLQLSVFMPVCSVDFAPWRITDEKLRAQVKRMYNLRASWINFLSSTVDQVLKTAEPLIRNMEYQFPRTGFADCDDQFMFADKYLVVIPNSDSQNKLVRLPRGVWKNEDGKIIKGPLVTSVDVSEGKIIYFELTTK